MRILSRLRNLKRALDILAGHESVADRHALIGGRILSELVRAREHIASLHDVEFRVFSQWGDDGIIQWLVHNLDFPHRTFVEFGVEDYRESNTRFLMMNDNWSGFVMDGSPANVERIRAAEYFWRHDLAARAVFVDRDNINDVLATAGLRRDVGILHIDLDGNDYWIWKEIDVISPIVVILEYNSIFGADRAITVPYRQDFLRTAAHHSNLYFGASLKALNRLSLAKGYALVGCNSAGNNAYFVRRDKLNDRVREASIEIAFVVSKFRESRDRDGKLTLLRGAERLEAIRGMPIFNVETNEVESL